MENSKGKYLNGKVYHDMDAICWEKSSERLKLQDFEGIP